jgi:hypothetical protein
MILIYMLSALSTLVAIVFWGCLPGKDEPNTNPFS